MVENGTRLHLVKFWCQKREKYDWVVYVYSHFEIGVIVKDLHCKTGIICDNYLFSSAHFEKSLYFYDSSAYFHTYCIFIHLENVTNVTVLTMA